MRYSLFNRIPATNYKNVPFCCRDNIRKNYSAGRKICPAAYEKFLNVTNNLSFLILLIFTKSLEMAKQRGGIL
jgi:hypothetical protein